jgi:hypothetical protein
VKVVRGQRYDVIVVGGGAAGIAAAVGAARYGAKTLLVERYGFLGGAATNASVLSYCGFYAQGEQPRLMVDGIGGAVLARLGALGMDATPRRSPSGNWIVMLDGEGVKRAFDDLASDIDCRLHCTLVGAQRNGSRIEALTVFDHTGTFDVTAASVVDASGDADLGYAAQAPLMVEVDPARERQVASFPVRIGGVASDIAIDNAALASIRESFPSEHPHGRVRAGGGHIMRLPHSGDLWWMGIDLVTDGLDSADMARAERLGRELAWDFVQRMKSGMPGFANAYIVATGPQLGVRDTRQVEPQYMLTDDDVLTGRLRDDAIARGCWPAELHQGAKGPRFHPIGGDGYYSVPLAALHARGLDNLWLGGRVIGCAPLAYGSLRVMGTAFATGHAAGIAAAHVSNGGRADEVEAIRMELVRQRALL